MDRKLDIIDVLTKIAERSALLRHGDSVVLDGLNLAEVHCIDQIGVADPANVTKIADAMRLTRGAVSKITKKLLCKGLVESYQRPGNNKEIYFRLMAGGWQIFEEHKICHSKARQDKLAVLAGYNDEEQAVILRFLRDVLRLNDDETEA